MGRKTPKPPSDAHVDAWVTGAVEAAHTAINALPWRPTPSFEDFYTGLGAAIEFMATTKPEDMDVEEPPVPHEPNDHDIAPPEPDPIPAPEPEHDITA